MMLLKPTEARQQPQSRHPDACRHSDGPPAFRNADGVDDVLQVPHGDISRLEQTLALRSEGNLAVSAREELDAEELLERAHLSADCRLGEAEILRCERDAHTPAYRNKAANEVHGWKVKQRN